jgi:diamine N-acetyltransferase
MSQPETYCIRAASQADIPAIERIARASWESAYLDVFLSRPQLEYDLAREYAPEVLSQQMAGHQTFVILADDANQPIGFAAYSADLTETTTLFLNKLYLDPHLKGQGYGRFLLNYVFNEALRQGFSQLALLVNRRNPAVTFYKHLGFVITANVDTAIGESYWRNDYRMIKTLT